MQSINNYFFPPSGVSQSLEVQSPTQPRRASFCDLAAMSVTNAVKAFGAQVFSTGSTQFGKLAAASVLLMTESMGDEDANMAYGLAVLAGVGILVFDSAITSRTLDALYGYCCRKPVHDEKGELIEQAPPAPSMLRRGTMTIASGAIAIVGIGLSMNRALGSTDSPGHVQDMRNLAHMSFTIFSARAGRCGRDFIQQYVNQYLPSFKAVQADGKALPDARAMTVVKRELLARFLLYAASVSTGVVVTEYVMNPWLGSGKPKGDLLEMMQGLAGAFLVSPLIEALDEVSILTVQAISARVHGHELHIVPAKLVPEWKENAKIQGGLRAYMGAMGTDSAQLASLGDGPGSLIGQGVSTLCVSLMEFRAFMASYGRSMDVNIQMVQALENKTLFSFASSPQIIDDDGEVTPNKLPEVNVKLKALQKHQGLSTADAKAVLDLMDRGTFVDFMTSPVDSERFNLGLLKAGTKHVNQLRALKTGAWVTVNGRLAALRGVSDNGRFVLAQDSKGPRTYQGAIWEVASFTKALPGSGVGTQVKQGDLVLLDGHPVLVRANTPHAWGRMLEVSPRSEKGLDAMNGDPGEYVPSDQGEGRFRVIVGEGADGRIHVQEGHERFLAEEPDTPALPQSPGPRDTRRQILFHYSPGLGQDEVPIDMPPDPKPKVNIHR